MPRTKTQQTYEAVGESVGDVATVEFCESSVSSRVLFVKGSSEDVRRQKNPSVRMGMMIKSSLHERPRQLNSIRLERKGDSLPLGLALLLECPVALQDDTDLVVARPGEGIGVGLVDVAEARHAGFGFELWGGRKERTIAHGLKSLGSKQPTSTEDGVFARTEEFNLGPLPAKAWARTYKGDRGKGRPAARALVPSLARA